VQNAKRGNILVFSESFDSNWIAVTTSDSKNKITSIRHNKIFNSFILPKDGNYSLEVYYEPQKWANIGFWISGVSFVIIIGVLGFGYIGRKW
jgi:hypothetical protein